MITSHQQPGHSHVGDVDVVLQVIQQPSLEVHLFTDGNGNVLCRRDTNLRAAVSYGSLGGKGRQPKDDRAVTATTFVFAMAFSMCSSSWSCCFMT